MQLEIKTEGVDFVVSRAPLPALLADLLNLHPTTAVRWTRQAGGDWTRYAANLARTRNHQPRENP
jgi:hypothetical protein